MKRRIFAVSKFDKKENRCVNNINMMMKKLFFLIVIMASLTSCEYDDSNVWDKLDELEGKITAIDSTISAMNKDIKAMQVVISVLENGFTIKSVTPVLSNGVISYYVIVFTNGEEIKIYNGSDGTDAPTVGIMKAADGVYYWTYCTYVNNIKNETYLLDLSGNKMPVSGATPQISVDGEGYWTITSGSTTNRLTDSEGNPVKAKVTVSGNGISSSFSSVIIADDYLTLVLANGTELNIMRYVNLSFVISNASSIQTFADGDTKSYTVTQSNVSNVVISKPDGWKVVLSGNTLSVTSPSVSNTYAEKTGTISIIAFAASGQTTLASLNVSVN